MSSLRSSSLGSDKEHCDYMETSAVYFKNMMEKQSRGTSAHFQTAAVMYKSIVTTTTSFPRETVLN